MRFQKLFLTHFINCQCLTKVTINTFYVWSAVFIKQQTAQVKHV